METSGYNGPMLLKEKKIETVRGLCLLRKVAFSLDQQKIIV